MRYVFPPLTDYAEKIHVFGGGRPMVAPTMAGVDCLCGGIFAVWCGRPKVAPTVGNGIMNFNSLIFCLREYLCIKYGYTLSQNPPPNP